jgi:hypothetical protein
MSVVHDEPAWTLEDLLALPDDGHRHELLSGAIVMRRVPSARHADYVDDLATTLRKVCSAELRVRTNSGIIIPGTPVINAPGADLYVCPRSATGDPYVTASDVILVVEMSLSTFAKDSGRKAAAYAAGGIPWYWMVQRDRSIHVHRLEPTSGCYEVAQVVRPGVSVQILGPEQVPFVFDPGTLGLS